MRWHPFLRGLLKLKCCMLSVTYAQIPAVVENLMNSGKKEVFFCVSFFYFFIYFGVTMLRVTFTVASVKKKKEREQDRHINHLQMGSLEENKYVSCSPGLC